MNHLEYQEKIKELFSEWKNKPKTDVIDHSDRFIEDGVVCPQKWFSQEVRPLFLLKEAYTKDGTMSNLISHLMPKETDGLQPISKMWKRISDWTRSMMILSETGEIVPFGSYEQIKYYGNEYLAKTAVINIKKSSGEDKSNKNNLTQYAENDHEEIYKELLFCDPTLIICGYTGELLFKVLKKNDVKVDKTKQSSFDKAHFVYRFELNGHPVTLVNFWHPANEFPDLLNYYGLMYILKEII